VRKFVYKLKLRKNIFVDRPTALRIEEYSF
jgi:hypothetical protein